MPRSRCMACGRGYKLLRCPALKFHRDCRALNFDCGAADISAHRGARVDGACKYHARCVYARALIAPTRPPCQMGFFKSKRSVASARNAAAGGQATKRSRIPPPPSSIPFILFLHMHRHMPHSQPATKAQTEQGEAQREDPSHPSGHCNCDGHCH